MSYAVKEIFFTLQGEGRQVGRATVFCRFSGCNLWSGREQDRMSAACSFCDTDFVGVDGVGGGRFATAALLGDAIEACWGSRSGARWVVLTGGEPLLQVDETLIHALHERGFKVAVETNGTQLAPVGIDWVCVSPKGQEPLLLTRGHELKLVFPQINLDPAQFERLDFEYFSLQPMAGPNEKENLQLTLDYCLEHPQWHLSIQTHKLLGIP